MSKPAELQSGRDPLSVSKTDAQGFAELVKPLVRRDLGPNDLNLVTHDEEPGANDTLLALRDALAEKGFAPR
jgi:hypothetical protein